MTIRAIAFFWKNFAIVRTVITRIRPDTDIRSQNIRSVIFTSVTIHDFLFLVQDSVFYSHHHNKKSINVFQAVSAAFKNVSASVFYLYIGNRENSIFAISKFTFWNKIWWLYTTLHHKYTELFLFINNNFYICAMRLVEQHTIKSSSVYYNELYDLLHKCKKLIQ